jgi:hypothetical protein
MGAHLRRGAPGLTGRAPAIVVHSLAHAIAALGAATEARLPIVLLSAPEAALTVGPGWWRALVDAGRAAVPDARFTAVLDCGDDSGAAQAAIRAGVEALVFTGRPDVVERLTAIAGQRGATLLIERPAAALDLGELFFADLETLRRRCADVLASI